MGILNIIGGFFGLIIAFAVLSAIVYSLVKNIQLARKIKFEENAAANFTANGATNTVANTVANTVSNNGNNINSNLPIPNGTGFLGCYAQPTPFNDQGDTALSQFVEVDCNGPCPDVCKTEALKLFPDGAIFATNASGQCRVGPIGQPYDNAGTADCGAEGSLRVYETL